MYEANFSTVQAKISYTSQINITLWGCVGVIVDSWKERLPEILQGYKKEDIWNLDETVCFWWALPDKGFSQKGKQCKGSNVRRESL